MSEKKGKCNKCYCVIFGRKCIRGGHIDSSFSERFKMANLKVVLILGLICLPTIEPYFARYMLQNMDFWNRYRFNRVTQFGRKEAQARFGKIIELSQSKHSTNNFSLFWVILSRACAWIENFNLGFIYLHIPENYQALAYKKDAKGFIIHPFKYHGGRYVSTSK